MTPEAWADQRVVKMFGLELPILLAPMAGAGGWALGAAVSTAGGLGSVPCAMLSPDRTREEAAAFRAATSGPLNLNFFCHQEPSPDPVREAEWRSRLAPYYTEFGLAPDEGMAGAGRKPFDEAACEIVEEVRPEVVSFHFGLPAEPLLERVRRAGAKVMSSATTVAEAVWLAERQCDAVIAQGLEAGGHRGTFLGGRVEGQIGTMALVPQIVDAVRVPVVAAGGIGDGRGIAAALMLGAAAVQLGSAYLRCPETITTEVQRRALEGARAEATVLTNVFTGRLARGIANRLIREVGPTSEIAPEFPLAASAVGPLRAVSEAAGSVDFVPVWAGQSVSLAREMPARELTLLLAREAAATLQKREQAGSGFLHP